MNNDFKTPSVSLLFSVFSACSGFCYTPVNRKFNFITKIKMSI